MSGGLLGDDGGESTSSSGDVERTDLGDWGDGAQHGLPQRDAGEMPSGLGSWCVSSSSSSVLSLTKRLMPNLISSVKKNYFKRTKFKIYF